MTLDRRGWTQAATPVRHLYIPQATLTALRTAGVYTVGRILELDASGLRALPGIGDIEILQVRAALERIGVRIDTENKND